MSDTYTTNLAAWYGRADSEDWRQGKEWYAQARGECYDRAKEFGYSLKRACYAVAALSNNMEWRQNLELLTHVMYAARHGMQARGHYGRCLHKARVILMDGNFAALRGPKVIPFARAIYGDMSVAVVDRWVWRAAWTQDITMYPPRLTDVNSALAANALRELARIVRQPVAIAQAIVWVTVRRGADPTQQPIPF